MKLKSARVITRRTAGGKPTLDLHVDAVEMLPG